MSNMSIIIVIIVICVIIILTAGVRKEGRAGIRRGPPAWRRAFLRDYACMCMYIYVYIYIYMYIYI